jgi:rhodanese-related sulfurtransferase
MYQLMRADEFNTKKGLTTLTVTIIITVKGGDEAMKRILILAMTLMMTMILAGCAGASKTDSMESSGRNGAYHKISQAEAKKMMTENPDVIILDVRTADEYAEKHIPHARLVPNEEIGDTMLEGLNKDDVILVYCRSGRRSKAASDKLVKMGYTAIYDFGGITTWPYETEAGPYQGI